jgi:hypothetical protein
VRSLLSLLSYLGSGTYRERYPGVKIPPTGIQDYHLETARKFADELASRVAGAGVPHQPGRFPSPHWEDATPACARWNREGAGEPGDDSHGAPAIPA